MELVEPNRRGDWVDRLSKSVQQHESSRRMAVGVSPRYEIQQRLGRGGMGAVYRAMDRVLSREVALKVLVDPLGAPAEARTRFLQEARLAATLQHPNIVPVFDAGEHEGQVFLAMQLIDGRGLEDSGLGLREAVAAVRDAARAVHYAHERGIIHRDLKPSNVMVDRTGRVYVTDFGLARRSDSAARMTLTGTIIGTPIYMPPEQARGNETDARSDVYSLGATLYELASGKPPFKGANELEILKHVLLDEPPFPRTHAPSLPQDLEAVIVKALDKKPTGRYVSAAALADDLDRWLRSEPVRAPVRGVFYRLRKRIVRHRWRVLAIVATIGFLISSAAFAWAYVRAYRNYSQGMNLKETNRDEAIALFEDAAAYLPQARKERDELKLLREKETKNRVDAQEAAAKAQAAAKKKLEEEEIAAQQNLIKKDQETVKLHGEFLSAINKGDARAAKLKLGELESRGTPDLQNLHEALLKLEYDEGIRRLKDFAAKGLEQDFREELTKLSGDTYLRQPNRNNLLIGACQELAAHSKVRPADKIDALKKAEELGEKSPQLFEQRGMLYYQLDRPDSAYQDYRTFRSRAGPQAQILPGYADLLVDLAGSARKRQTWKEALGFLNEALAIKTNHAGALLSRSIVRFHLKEPARAVLTDFAAALQISPELKPQPEHITAAGSELREVAERTWAMKDAGAARIERTQAVDLTLPVLRSIPGEPAAPLLELAKMRLRLGKLDEALADARRAANSVNSSLVRSQILYLLGKNDPKFLQEALQEIDGTAEIDRMALAWYWRGVIREALQLNDAPGDLREAERRGLKGPDLFIRLARASLAAKQEDKAIDFATRALADVSPSEDEFLTMLAESAEGSRDMASRQLKVSALYYRARGFFRKGDYEGCRKDCTEILALDRTHREALYHRGLALNGLKNYDAAIEDFDKLIELDPRHFDAFAARGTAKWTKGDEKGGKRDYSEALKHAPADWEDGPKIKARLNR